MTIHEFTSLLAECPLVASVQADHGTPLDNPDSIVRLAQASISQGVKVLRLQGVEDIRAVQASCAAAIVGLIKAHVDAFEPYITPTLAHIDALLETGCEIIGLDGTKRSRPDGSSLREAIERIHAGGALAMSDVDSAASGQYALQCGADILSTTLAGYTQERERTEGPDLACLRSLTSFKVPILGEGRYNQHWQVEAALRIGAFGVVIGGALNDPIKTTNTLMPSTKPTGNVGAVDLGGTWLRFGLFSPGGHLIRHEKIPNPATHAERCAWVSARAKGLERVGISAGGTVDPKSSMVTEAKPIIPDHQGHNLTEFAPEANVYALNDGHATAWGHACLPQFAGRRVATLAFGTGVGCGFVSEQRIWMGAQGEYPRLNDLALGEASIEDALGGANLGATGETRAQRARRSVPLQPEDAAREAIHAVNSLFFPEAIVICGGVGLSKLMKPLTDEFKLIPSPFGEDAGLYGAAALALYPFRR